MDPPMSDCQLQQHVEQKIHNITTCLVRQLMTLPAVTHVEVTGHLSVVVNKRLTFVVFLPPDFNSECISTAAFQCMCTPQRDQCSSCKVTVGQFVGSSVVEKSEENEGVPMFKASIDEDDEKGLQTPAEHTHEVLQTGTETPVTHDHELKKISTITTSGQNLSLASVETTQDLDDSNHALTNLETGINDSQDVGSVVSDRQDLRNIANGLEYNSQESLNVSNATEYTGQYSLNALIDTEYTGLNSQDSLDRSHKATASRKSKLSLSPQNKPARPTRKRGRLKKLPVSLENEMLTEASILRENQGKQCKQQIFTKELVQNEEQETQHKQRTLDKKDGPAPSEGVVERPHEVSEETPKKASELQCSVCGKTYPAGKHMAFRKHVKTHTQSVQCDICGKWLSSAGSLKNHQRGLHSKEKPYSCKECGESFSFYHSFKLHGYKHSGSRPYVCPHCSKAYLTSSHLKAHLISAHTREKDRQPQFQCETCGRSFASAASLKTHSFRHSNVKPFHCEVCSKGFGSKSALKLHGKSVHVTDRKFECDVCHKLYKSQHLLNIHQQRHTAEENGRFICDVCGRQFMVPSSLKAHALVHQPTCPYTCKICGKGFKLLPSLYSHRYTHTTERPFQCSKCPKVFKTKSACTAHEQRHTATKAFACQRCDARFPDKGGLDKHTRTIHSLTNMLQCMVCGKVGTRMDNMRTHVKSHGRDKTFEQLNACIKPINS